MMIFFEVFEGKAKKINGSDFSCAKSPPPLCFTLYVHCGIKLECFLRDGTVKSKTWPEPINNRVFFGLATLHTFPCRLKTLLWFLFSDDYESRPSTYTWLLDLVSSLQESGEERERRRMLSCSVCISSSFFSPPFPKRISPFPSLLPQEPSTQE